MYLLLGNPTSGGGRGADTINRVKGICERLELKFEDISGSSYESARINLRQAILESSVAGVILIGGDGMVHLAIQELAGTDIPLALIPAGTGNDFARSCNLPLEDPELILEKLTSTQPSYIDLGRVNGRYFAEILSTGFDSIVNERANRIRWKSKRKYDLAMLLELPVFRPLSYRLNLDGESIETKAMLIAVANGKSYGGGMKVCPDADLSDGLFDVMILEPVSKLEFLKVFPKVFEGTHKYHPQVQIHRAKKVSIEAQAVAYADGERIGPLPVSAENHPKALLIWGSL